jgi:hypothetical protein
LLEAVTGRGRRRKEERFSKRAEVVESDTHEVVYARSVKVGELPWYEGAQNEEDVL